MAKTKVTIRWNNDGFKEILNSSALQQELQAVADEVAKEAGEGFVTEGWKSNMKGGRPAVSVRADSYEARKAEATDKALTKAINTCRKG